MIIVENSADGSQVHILARGNFSLKASGLYSLLAALGVVSLGLAGALAALGYWPILLMAVLQLVLVSWVFIRVWKDSWIFEEVQIDNGQIQIVRQRYRSRSRICLETAWATIRLEPPAVSWYPRKLILRCKTQQVELGAFLTEDEKVSLAKHLSNALSKHTAWRK